MKYLLILALILYAAAQDWCNIENCAPNSHVQCQNPYSGMSQLCTHNQASETTMTQNLQDIILNRHNFYRNLVAGGTVAGANGVLPSATRMASVRWSPQLAHFARLNAMRCIFDHDECRRSPDFTFAGQNLAGQWTTFDESSPNFVMSEYLMRMIDIWFNEHQNTRIIDIQNFTTLTNNGQPIGHFTVLANELQTHIGCGLVHYNDGGLRFHYFVCNYAITNIRNFRVYTSGPPGTTGTQCRMGRNPNFNNLCSLSEDINPNPFITSADIVENSEKLMIDEHAVL